MSTTRQKAKSCPRPVKKQNRVHNLPKSKSIATPPPAKRDLDMFPQTEKGISAPPERDDPGSQKSLDLAAFPATHYVFLVSKTTVST